MDGKGFAAAFRCRRAGLDQRRVHHLCPRLLRDAEKVSFRRKKKNLTAEQVIALFIGAITSWRQLNRYIGSSGRYSGFQRILSIRIFSLCGSLLC